MSRFLPLCIAITGGLVACLIVHMVVYITLGQSLSGVLLRYGAVVATLGVFVHGWISVRCARLVYRYLTESPSLAEERTGQIRQAINKGEVDRNLTVEFKTKLHNGTSKRKVNDFLCEILKIAESIEFVESLTDRLEYTIYGLFLSDFVIYSNGGDSGEILTPYVDEVVSIIDTDYLCYEEGEEIFRDRLVSYSKHIGGDDLDLTKIHDKLAMTMIYSRHNIGVDVGLEKMYVDKDFKVGTLELLPLERAFSEVFERTMVIIDKEFGSKVV